MATYGSIYEFALTSSNGADILIVISKKFYDGKTTRRPLGRAPILKRENSGRVFGTSFEIYAECAVDGEYAQFYTSSADEFKVEVYKNDIRIWSGFISPELYSEPDIAPPYDVQIIATDGLGELKDYTSMREGITTLREHFNRLLQHTGLSLDFRFASSLEYACDNYIYQPYELCDLSIDLTHDADESCYEELQKLLTFLNAGITQFGDRWLIFRETDLINLAQGQTLQVFGSDGTYDYLNIASFGSSKSCPWWPIGQLSSVIKPAKNSLKLSAPNHYKDNVLTGLWEQFDGAVYDNSEGAYNLPVRGSSVKQSIDFSDSIDYRLMLRIKARNVGYGGLDQSLAVQVKMHGISGLIPGEAEEKDYYLWFPGTSDRGPASYTWTTDVKWITPSLAIPEASDTSSDAQDIEIVLPFYYSNYYDRAIARNIEITVQNPSGWHAIYVYDVALYKYDQFAGYEANVKINNGAREEASDIDLTVTNGHDIPVVGSMFMTGIPLIPGNTNKPIDSWRIHASEFREYLSTMALDYSRSMALPRMEYKGILNVPAGGLPALFLRDNTYYFPQTYSYDLYNDELEVSLISVPAAEVEIGSIQISELTGNRGSSGSTGSSNGAGGGSTGGGFGGGGQIVDTEMSDNSSNVVGNNVIKAYVDDQIATVVSRIVEAEKITKKFDYDDDGLFTNENFRSYKQIAVGEVGSPDGGGSSGSGVMLLESWSDVPNSLSGYALSAALGIDLHERFNNYYTIGDVDNRFSGINSRLATLDSGMADRYTKDESDGRYLKLSGGTITGDITTPFAVNTLHSREVGMYLKMSGSNVGWLGYTPNVGIYLYTYGNPNHKLGISDEGVGFIDSYTLIHSGNIGSYKAGNSAQLGGRNAELFAYYSNSSTYIAFNLPSTFTDLGQGDGYIEYYDNGGWYNSIWGKVTAVNGFVGNLSGNASSATKLATARTIWGQSFDGTGDVSGAFTTSEDFIIDTTKYSDVYWARGISWKQNGHDLGLLCYTAVSDRRISIVHGAYNSSVGLHILSNGNVLIGPTTDSGYRLDVAGTGRFSNLLTASAGISTPHITIGGITISVVDGVLRIDGNVYTTGQLGVGAVGQEGGGTGGGGVLLLNTWPTDGGSYAGYALGGNLGIDLNTRVKTLEGKATAVSFSQTLTSGKQIGVLTIDGSSSVLYAPSTYAWSEITSRPSKLSDFTDDVVSGKYLPLTGGKMTVGKVIQWGDTDNMIYATANAMHIYSESNLFINGNQAYHAGNFNPADYLPLSGGTITRNLIIASANDSKIVLNETGGDYKYQLIEFQDHGTMYGVLGTMGSGDLVWNGSTIIHSGNIGSQKVASADSAKILSESYLENINYTHRTSQLKLIRSNDGNAVANGFPIDYMSGLSVMAGYTGWQLVTYGGSSDNNPYFRKVSDKGVWSDWKQIAYTDSNVASATKLATPRTIWGQSFDGTGNVSGNLHVNNHKLYWHSDAENYSIGSYYDGTTTALDIKDYSKIRFFTAAIERMRIMGNGNVLIGTTTDSGAKLTVDGIVRAKGFKSQTLSIECNNEGTDYYGYGWSIDNYNNPLYIQASTSANLALCTGGGNVGIGTNNPAYKLDVAGTARISGATTLSSTLSVSGLVTASSGIKIGSILLTDENGTLKIAGNAYTTGQLGAGEAGQPTSGGGGVILDYDSVVDALGFTPAKQNDLSSLTSRVLALESAGPSSSSSSLYGDEITIGSSMGNIYISSENDVQIDTIMGSVLVNGSEVLTKANTAFTRLYTSGTKIGTIKIGGTSTDIYVPASGSSSLWTTEYDMENDIYITASQNEYIGTNSIVGWESAGSYMSDLHIGMDGYTIYMYGSVDESSDMRLKTVIDAVNLDIRDIAFAPIFNYVFKSRPQGRQMLGSSAQYWQAIAPKAVSENDKGNLAMNYGAIALASVVAVAKKTLTHEEEIANLKLKVQSLESRLARYELN